MIGPGARCAFAFALISAAAIGCGEPAPRLPAGTQRMADTLAALYQRSLLDPTRDPFLNQARAEAILRRLSAQGGQFDPQGHFILAMERLSAGQTREAIGEFEGIIRSMGLSDKKIDPQAKIVFDFLAMSYLRLGEQENCLGNPAANVCILPLDGAARHTKQEGARKAITLFEALLRDHPDDLGSRWLLNMAYLAVGGYPDSIPAKYLIRGIAPKPGATFPLFHNIAYEAGVAVDGLSGGLAVEDFDRDGHLDLFVTSWGLADRPTLLMADGNGGYEDRTEAAGLAGLTGGLNVTHADYDNDGFEDLFVMRGAWLGDGGTQPNSLIRNRGDGTFEDVTFAAGLYSIHPTPTAQWADFNLDGRLDLFVGHESGAGAGGGSHRSELFLNNGNGTFREVAREVGITLDAFVKSVAWGDVNNDGLPDLYASVLFGPNRLYLNRGGTSVADWRFEERAGASAVERPIASFGSWFFDVDGDGWDDLLALSYDVQKSGSLHDAVAREYVDPRGATNSPNGVESSRLYRNNRDGTFSDVTRAAGLEDKVIFAMGSNFGDVDNDGWLDFYLGTGNPDLRSIIPNRMFRSVAGKRFEEVTLEGGFGHIQKGHGTAFVDLDRDGDNDVYMVMGGAYQGDRFWNVLFENPGWPERGWVRLELEGTTANRSAIGARVRVVVDEGGKERTIHRTVGTGGAFGAGSLSMVVGVGGAQRIVRVEVSWPDAARSVTTYDGLELKRTYRIVQGSAPAVLDRPSVPFGKQGIASHATHSEKP